MIQSRHYEPDDLALFAMQLLPKEEANAVAMHLVDCPVCRRELAEIQGDLAAYAFTAEMHSPPLQTRERLMKQLAREKRSASVDRAPISPLPEYDPRMESRYPSATPAPTPYRAGLGSGRYLEEEDDAPRRHIALRLLPWAGWALAAGVAIMAGGLYRERETLRSSSAAQAKEIDRLSADQASARQLIDAMTDPKAMRVVLSPASAPVPQTPPQPQGRITYVPEKGTLIFMANNLEPLERYKTYELWLIPADGRDPIPAGTFHPDDRGNASIVMPPMPKGIEAKAFGITIEDENGSQTPTMPIILAGS